MNISERDEAFKIIAKWLKEFGVPELKQYIGAVRGPLPDDDSIEDVIIGGGSGGGAGTPGAPGATGSAGAQGPAVFIEAEQGDQGDFGLPGIRGLDGVPGSTGAQGIPGPAIFLEADTEVGDIGPPGVRGVDGTSGSNGTQGAPGPAIFLEAEPGDDGIIGPPGATGATGASGAGGIYNAFTKDLGAARRSGNFDITGLAGLTAEKVVSIVQTAAQIASKGNARDEPEMDQIKLTGYVVDAATIRSYWHAPSVVVGTYAFAYQVSG